MIVVFSYLPAVHADRHISESVPERLRFHSMYLSDDSFSTAVFEPGDYAVYESKGNEQEPGVQPRLELTDRLRVHEPEVPKVKVSKLKKLG